MKKKSLLIVGLIVVLVALVGEIEKILKDLSWDIPFESINLNYIPDERELNEVKKIGENIGKYLKK